LTIPLSVTSVVAVLGGSTVTVMLEVTGAVDVGVKVITMG
jgi:hypothetical protein